MLASVVITVVSIVLLCYWFRYVCLLLLRSRSEQATGPVDNRFSFWEVRDRIETAPELGPLQHSLEETTASSRTCCITLAV